MASTTSFQAPPAPSALKTTELDIDTPKSEDKVQSPSLSNLSARARFEFENGQGNEGTKILMVEWEDDEQIKKTDGKWVVNWEGKPQVVLPVEEKAEEKTTTDEDSAPSTSDSDSSRYTTSHRQYFLLGPKVPIPAIVTLTLTPSDGNATPVVWKTNPLPAIFPGGLADPKSKRGKGVLHTLWAEKRLAKLNQEIEEEARHNLEGIALQMAIEEKEWIENTFGLVKEEKKAPPPLNVSIKPQDVPLSPSSPLSPGGSRLSEKLKGLKLQTKGESDSPQSPPTAPKAASTTAAAPQPVAAAIQPPSVSGMGSIGAILSGQTNSAPPPAQDDGEEAGLFALPMSPRSPEMTKSPFSFTADDTKRYVVPKSVS